MKNFYRLLGIVALVATIGFSMTACTSEPPLEDFTFPEALTGRPNTDLTDIHGRRWVMENDSSKMLEFSNYLAGDNRIRGIVQIGNDGLFLTILRKSGDRYTTELDYLSFTAKAGADGKLTISEASGKFTGDNFATFDLADFNGMYIEEF